MWIIIYSHNIFATGHNDRPLGYWFTGLHSTLCNFCKHKERQSKYKMSTNLYTALAPNTHTPSPSHSPPIHPLPTPPPPPPPHTHTHIWINHLLFQHSKPKIWPKQAGCESSYIVFNYTFGVMTLLFRVLIRTFVSNKWCVLNNNDVLLTIFKILQFTVI